jgi:hypothetical protein
MEAAGEEGVKLRPYQKRDIKRALKDDTRGVLNGSDMGTGKTLFGVELMHRIDPKQLLIIGPVNTFDGWERHVREHTGRTLQRLSSVAGDNWAYMAGKEFIKGKPGWYFVNWETATRLRYDLFKNDAVIFDEIHRASNRKFIEHKGSGVRMAYTVGRQVAVRGGWRVGLSGTWKGNKEEGAWAVQRILWPLQSEQSFWRWARHHLSSEITELQKWNPLTRRMETTLIETVGAELDPGSIVRELPGAYIRHEPDSRCCKDHPHGVNADLPARVVHRVGVDLTKAQRKIYDQMDEEMMAWIKDHDYPLESQGYPLVQMLRLHQACLAVPSTELAYRLVHDKETDEKTIQEYIAVSYPEKAKSSKIDALVEIVSDLPPGEKVLVFTHSAGIIGPVVARLGESARGWHGGVSHRDRAAIKKGFIDGDVRVIVAQIASIGEGTDGLQLACHNEVWLSLSEDRVKNTQAMSRLHRSGQTQPVQSFQIYARDTKEEAQYERHLQAHKAMAEGLKERRK